MKSFIVRQLQNLLRGLAVRVIAKYQPKIIGITGSVGKTSTTAAIATVLGTKFRVGQSLKNYNNELGLPLSILRVTSGGRSVVGWLRVIGRGLRLLLWRDASYPEILVLEMGADAPGDLAYLTSFVPLDVAVVSRVAPAHVSALGDLENIAKEKSTLVRVLPKHGVAVLNADDSRVAAMAAKCKGRVVTFGLLPGAEVLASEVALSHDVDYRDISTLQGISFKVTFGGSTVPFLLPNVLGEQMVSVALGAIAVGTVFGLHLVEISQALRQYASPPGRMRIVPGIKHTLIIDDSYNSSPYAATSALHQLSEMNVADGCKKYALLGSMLELGNMSEQAHRELGEAAARYGVDVLITVGEEARDIMRGALEAGLHDDQCFHFSTSTEAARFVQDRLREGDLMLIKGSQGVRMERAVKELMAEPDRAAELIVRQGQEWL